MSDMPDDRAHDLTEILHRFRAEVDPIVQPCLNLHPQDYSEVLASPSARYRVDARLGQSVRVMDVELHECPVLPVGCAILTYGNQVVATLDLDTGELHVVPAARRQPRRKPYVDNKHAVSLANLPDHQHLPVYRHIRPTPILDPEIWKKLITS